MAGTNTKKNLVGLDSYRFFAFLAVFFFHTGLLHCGYLGVQAFFVLSGFLLTPILLDMKDHLSNRNYFLNFYGRRVLRIFPLYYFFLALSGSIVYLLLANGGFGADVTLGRMKHEYLYALTYTFDFLRAGKGPASSPYGHLWSLAVEEQFYLVWPLILVLTPKNRRRHVLLGIAALAVVFRIVEYCAVQYNIIPALNPNYDQVIYELPFSHLDAFAFGGFLALFEVRRARLQFVLLLVGIPIVGMVTQYLALGYIDWKSLGYNGMADSFKFVWGYSAINYFFALFLWQIVHHDLLHVLFHNRAFAYLGKISYGLYVYHLPILWIGMHNESRLGLPHWLMYLLCLVATVLVSMASYHLFEQRFLRLKDALFPKKKPEKDPVALQVSVQHQ